MYTHPTGEITPSAPLLPIDQLPPAPTLYDGPFPHEPVDYIDPAPVRIDLIIDGERRWFRATDRPCRWCGHWYRESTVGACAWHRAGKVRGAA